MTFIKQPRQIDEDELYTRNQEYLLGVKPGAILQLDWAGPVEAEARQEWLQSFGGRIFITYDTCYGHLFYGYIVLTSTGVAVAEIPYILNDQDKHSFEVVEWFIELV